MTPSEKVVYGILDFIDFCIRDFIFCVIALSVFLIPISGIYIIKGADAWVTQYIVFFFFGFLVVALRIGKYSKPLSLLAITALVSTVFFTGLATKALVTMVQLFISLLAIVEISRLDAKKRKILLFCLFGITLIQCVYMTLQFFNLDPFLNWIADPTLDDTVGFSGSHNQIGIFLATTAPVMFYFCPYLIFLTAFGLWCATTSTAWLGFVSGMLVLTKFMGKEVFQITVLILAVFILSMFSNKNVSMHEPVREVTILSHTFRFLQRFEHFSKESYKERIMLIKESIKQVESGTLRSVIDCTHDAQYVGRCDTISPHATDYEKRMAGCRNVTRKPICDEVSGHFRGYLVKDVKCNRWFGFGLGSFMSLSPLTQDTFLIKNPQYPEMHHKYAHAHNDYVETWFELGRLGLIALLIIIMDIFIKFFMAIKTRKNTIIVVCFAGIVAHMVCALGVFTVQTAVTAIPLIVMLGIFYGEVRDE